ncbi:MAG: minichromosome maintenance protein MCM [Candidatus Aenigmarchaeota archaeon]|nr:minichromosome maintenance protein MCM [Candidatus Aenigmarchaeota archaeon]
MPTLDVKDEQKALITSRFREFLRQSYDQELVKAALKGQALAVDFLVLDKHSQELSALLLDQPDLFFEAADEAAAGIDLPSPVKIRFFHLPESQAIPIRNLRSKHIGKLIAVEGMVRKASEIRPEIMAITWECPECGNEIEQPRKGTFIPKPYQCECGNKFGFRQKDKTLVDMRWIMIEEPFELTEGDKPSQVNLVMQADLTSPDFRRITDPGNRLLLTGVLHDIPKGKFWNIKLDFYMDVNHIEPKEIGWERLELSKEDEDEVKKLAADEYIYEKLIASLAPTLYGLEDIKESIILQLFGGIHRTLPDKTKSRGDIHILLIGDPASGKSQLLKLTPQIVPRGKYVSGKGTTAAGLTASVSKDEQFMGGWVLEAGAMVLANKGLLAIDEFEKMSPEDQVAMHEALEQGSVSIAKAAIVATLPAQTSVLAGGNPKFSRFDPYMAISKQITIPDTLMTRFDLKFALRDLPDAAKDRRVVEHMLSTREEGFEGAVPKIPSETIRKYIAYAKSTCKPVLTKDAGKLLKTFYLKMRKRAEGGSAVSITLRQFEALIRLAEASAKIQLSPEVRKQDAARAIRLMMASLRQLGMDPDTQEIDVDRAEGGTTARERSGIRVILEIINTLSETKKEIPVGEIEEAAKKEGVPNAEEIIEKLKKEGMLFEPNPGYVAKV